MSTLRFDGYDCTSTVKDGHHQRTFCARHATACLITPRPDDSSLFNPRTKVDDETLWELHNLKRQAGNP